MWPKMPKQWILGQVSGLDVDARDHVWIIQRPWSLNDDEKAKNPDAVCCTPAPPVMEFDAAGNYLQGWGGEAPEYEWPKDEHSDPRRLQRQRLDLVGRRTAAARADREPDSEVHAGREVSPAGRAPRQEQGQPRHRRTSTTPPTSTSTRRPTKSSSPTATSIAASSCSTPTPARSSACGAPTATRRTMQRRTGWQMKGPDRSSSTWCTACGCRTTGSSTWRIG